VPEFVWWVFFLGCGIWWQQMSGGLDFLTPGILVCIQYRKWWLTGILSIVFIFVQEGVGTLAFGASLLFYAGAYLLFYASHWLLEPENPLFMLSFSACLSCWLYGVVTGVCSFQELSVLLPSVFPAVFTQWLAYMLMWSFSLFVFRRWVHNGRV